MSLGSQRYCDVVSPARARQAAHLSVRADVHKESIPTQAMPLAVVKNMTWMADQRFGLSFLIAVVSSVLPRMGSKRATVSQDMVGR